MLLIFFWFNSLSFIFIRYLSSCSMYYRSNMANLHYLPGFENTDTICFFYTYFYLFQYINIGLPLVLFVFRKELGAQMSNLHIFPYSVWVLLHYHTFQMHKVFFHPKLYYHMDWLLSTKSLF